MSGQIHPILPDRHPRGRTSRRGGSLTCTFPGHPRRRPVTVGRRRSLLSPVARLTDGPGALRSEDPPRRSGNQPATPAPPEVAAASVRTYGEYVANIYKSRGQLRPLRRWLICWGSWVFVPTAIIFVVTGFLAGWHVAYEVLVGLTSPAQVPTPLAPWLLSLAGWLIVPAAIGGVVGYMLSARIDSYRSTPIQNVLDRLRGVKNSAPPSASGGDHGLPPNSQAGRDGGRVVE
ncbi:DUF6313 family protein [Streptomyces sp. LMG1-1-1.1]|uniref:DUF6313 family protein n=1 Tax=Streptomyces sp. LMG1-1-1.1 TaxID=3135245 RepID=UPI003464E9A0